MKQKFLLFMLLIVMQLSLYSQTPTITSFTPVTGPVGTLVTITGTNLGSPTTFNIGGVSAIIISNDGTSLVGMVMPGATTAAVSFTTAGGTATSSSNFTVTATPYPSTQQGAKLIGNDYTGSPYMGKSVAVSADGNTAIVGGYNDNNAIGAAWIYTRTGSTWSQQGIKLVGTTTYTPHQGISVSISADGNTAIVGGNMSNSQQGAVWVFTRSGTTWSQQAGPLVGSSSTSSQLGTSVSLSADGNTFIVGGPNTNSYVGAFWIFTRSGTNWSQQAGPLVGSGSTGFAQQGYSVAISADGNTAIEGGIYTNSLQGAVWIFTRSGISWTQQAGPLVGSGNTGAAQQGQSVSISADGNTAIEGGYMDNSGQGAVWIWARSGTNWSQQAGPLVGTGNTGAANQGYSVSLSADGNTAIEGGNSDNNYQGAAWVFTRSAGVWSQHGTKFAGTGFTGTTIYQGAAISLSADGSTAILGGNSDNTNKGAAWVFVNPPPAPTITSFTPLSAGSGATVTITGTNFTGATAVKFGGTAATSFSVVSATSITALVGSGTTGIVSVTAPGGIATSTDAFTFYQAPTVALETGSWLETQPVGNADAGWQSVSLSSNGSTMLAAVSNTRLYKSANGGTSWSETQPAGAADKGWQSVSVSANGLTMLACVYNGRLYTSANGGTSWNETQPALAVDKKWQTLSVSGDGLTMLAGLWNGRLYQSANGGTNWSETQPAGAANMNWRSVSLSSNGMTMLAATSGSRLYRSVNSGTSWSETQPAGNADNDWTAVSVSGDGLTMLACIYSGRLYKSVDGGTSWNETQPAGAADIGWQTVSLSSNGLTMVAAAYNGRAYKSTDGGANWSETTPTGTSENKAWQTASVSGDGSTMLAAVYGERIYRTLIFSPVTNTTASATGKITATNGSDASSRGAIWYEYSNTDKIIGGTGVTNVSNAGDFGTGTYPVSFTGLTPNTRYNARAHATNTYGTGYSERDDFWTLANVPDAPTVNNPTATTLDVTVNVNGNSLLTEFAIYETSTIKYLQANGTLGASAVWQTATAWGTKTVTGLTTGTTYTFKVKARNGANTETAFGTTASGIPVAKPLVTTQAATSITSITATANGNITVTGATNPSARGTIWYAYSNTDKGIGDAGVTNVPEAGSFSTGTFTSSLTGLAVNTQYNAIAYATNTIGTGYGSRVAFWTLANVPSAPTVNNPTATTLDVTVNVNSNPTTTEFAIKDSVNGTFVQANGSMGVSAVWQTASVWGTKTITGLTTGTTYTIQVKARNGGSTETSYSATSSGTPVYKPTVTTQAATSLATTTATGNGNITATNGIAPTTRGTIWYAYSNTDKVIGDAGVTNVSEAGSFATGSFTSSITGLAVNTQYNAIAYATNTIGTGYGARVAFWTLANVPSAPTVNNPNATTLDVTINVNSNPTTTEFAIYETSTPLYVQADGSLGASAVWQTATTWGTKTVTGLTTGSTYTFEVKARNGDNVETAYGATANGVPVYKPSVATEATTSITTTTATGNGNITAINGIAPTTRGTIWYAYSNTDKVIGDAGVTDVPEAGSFSTGAFTSSITGLAVNTQYNAIAYATNTIGTGYGARVAFWTLANVPDAPTVNNATATTLDIALNVNSNPTTTEFAIYETSTSLYLQANGSLGATAVWQTATAWGTKTVTGLTTGATYTFEVKARNGANTETAFGATAAATTCSNPTDGGSIAGAQTICSSANPQTLTNSVSPSGQTGTLEYKWQSSTTSASTGFMDIASATSDNYTPGLLSTTTWFKRFARVDCKSTWIASVESNVIEITIKSTPSPVITGSPDNFYNVPKGATYQYSTPANAGDLYSWSAPGLKGYCSANAKNCVNIQFEDPCGSYGQWTINVTETNPSTGCSATATKLIYITP